MTKVRKPITEKEFPSEYCIEDYFEASRWAAFVLDLEVVVSEFNAVLPWDYKSFLVIAERRNVIHLHRCAFYPSQTLRNDRKLNSIVFERIERLLLNTAKDIWLEPICPESEQLITLKRHVTGLYLLYFLWTTQEQKDNFKILISFTLDDHTRLGIFNERVQRLFHTIPNCIQVGKCIAYILESFKARHAFVYTFRSEEARLDRQYLQLVRVKQSDVRKTLLSIHANQHYESLLIRLESLCRKMSTILCEAEKAAQVPITMSVLLRNFVPPHVIRNHVLLEPESFKPVMLKLPGHYIMIAEQIIQMVLKNFAIIQRPFLSLDTLVQIDHVSSKIHSFGRVKSLSRAQKYAARKKKHSDSVRDFNQKCIEANREDKLVSESTRPYREMASYAWDFIHQRPVSYTRSLDRSYVVPRDFQFDYQDQGIIGEFDLTSINEEEDNAKSPCDSFEELDLDEDEKRIQSCIRNVPPMIAFESTTVLKKLL